MMLKEKNKPLIINKTNFGIYLIREIENNDLIETQNFLFSEIKKLYNFDKNYPHSQDIWELNTHYINSKVNLLLGAFILDVKTKKEILIGTIGFRNYDFRLPIVNYRYKNSKTAEVTRCYIKAEYRQHKIGTNLVKELIKQAKNYNYEILYLHTHKFLPGGYTFWKKQNFKVIIEDPKAKDQIVHLEFPLK